MSGIKVTPEQLSALSGSVARSPTICRMLKPLLAASATVRVIGPAPLEDHEPGPEGEPAPHRALLFFGYGVAGEVTRRLRAARSKAL